MTLTRERMRQAAEAVMTNGLTSSATLFMPAGNLADIMREDGNHDPETVRELEALGGTLVMIKSGVYTPVDIDDDEAD